MSTYYCLTQFLVAKHFTQTPFVAYGFTFTIINSLVYLTISYLLHLFRLSLYASSSLPCRTLFFGHTSHSFSHIYKSKLISIYSCTCSQIQTNQLHSQLEAIIQYLTHQETSSTQRSYSKHITYQKNQ